MSLILLLAATTMVPPSEPLAGKIRSAIWADLELNGMIGNGNVVASSWMNLWGSGKDAPTLHILGLLCGGSDKAQRCRFDLLRDGGSVIVDGRRVPDRISCNAKVIRSQGDAAAWGIPHQPPRPRGGHSRTTMHCEWSAPS